ncbi:aquaporin 12 [Alosa sapidissima]|uniref:aquaporin 12 n=1 Tax=Alosa sapidissima TaxID=34773 RepID=UPI001C09E127|nr:aquaporin 12 [Alosa sapidissima]
MSDLNLTLGYFLSVLGLSALLGLLLRRRGGRWADLAEIPAVFSLAACRLEVRTIEELGGWAAGLGPDVTLTILFLTLLAHGASWPVASGNPSVSLQSFLLLDGRPLPTLLRLLLQVAGAHLAWLAASSYWALMLTDMHMIKSLMGSECSSALRTSVLQGGATEAGCSLTFHLLLLSLQQRSAFLRVPLLALYLTFLSFAASGSSSGFANPALAYAVTFNCPGFSLLQYALVYWLGPLVGMTLALFFYMGHVPRLFSKNLLYSPKSRFRIPKKKDEQKEKSG